jgi:N-acetyltransferase
MQLEPVNAAPITNANPIAANTTLSGYGVRLEPLNSSHAAALALAASDGALWQLKFTSVPEPDKTGEYIEKALEHRALGNRFAFAVIEQGSDKVLGCTSYHDILPEVQRLEIGYTFYAKSAQRTHVNTACKWLLLTHAFDELQFNVVGWRTDNTNLASQRAIERLGAIRDGVIRGQALRRDGSIRDTVMYSVTRQEWLDGVKARVLALLNP